METTQINGTTETAIEIIPSAAQTAMYLITKAEIDTQIATAKAFPRSIKKFMDKAESMATVTEEVAASCNYAVPRAGKLIEGPSVRLAEIVVAAYGNIRAGARVVDNDGKQITAQGIVHDLENNTCVTIEVKQRITTKEGKMFSDDMIVNVGNSASAKAFRNAVFKVVPAALIEPIYDKTKEVAKGKAETMVVRRNKALEYAKQLGVTAEQICAKLDVAKVEDIDLDKLATFRAILNGIKNGETTAQEAFGKEENGSTAKPDENTTKRNRIEKLIRHAMTLDELNKHRKSLNEFPDLTQLFSDREDELTVKTEVSNSGAEA